MNHCTLYFFVDLLYEIENRLTRSTTYAFQLLIDNNFTEVGEGRTKHI